MTDEHLMRQWADAHSDFSSDLDRGLLRLGSYLSRRLQRRQPIGRPYGLSARAAARHDVQVNSPGRAALAGVMACVATTALLVAVASLATSGTIDAAALQPDIPTGSPIVGHAMA